MSFLSNYLCNIYLILRKETIALENLDDSNIPRTKWVNFAVDTVVRSAEQAGKLIEKYGSIKDAYDASTPFWTKM